MESNSHCRAPTWNGKPCTWPWDRCPVAAHRTWRSANGLPPSTPSIKARKEQPNAAAAPRPIRSPSKPALPASDDPQTAPKLEPPPAVEKRDMHALGWWALARMIEGQLTPAAVGAIAGVFRTLNAIAPDGDTEEENLANIALHGLLMHGIPPRNDAEWARAEAQFDDDALAEMRRWALLQGDTRHQREPLALGDDIAHEVDVPAVIDHEDGV